MYLSEPNFHMAYTHIFEASKASNNSLNCCYFNVVLKASVLYNKWAFSLALSHTTRFGGG